MLSKFEMTLDECEKLMKVLDHEYISYEEEVVHNLLRRIQQFIREKKNELA